MSNNPLLEDLYQTLPGVSIALPTRGIYYPAGTFQDGTDLNDFPVGVLTMVDEMRFRDPYLQASGKAMKEMVLRLRPQIQDFDVLCDIDIEAIILAARLASYGTHLDQHITCSNPDTYEEMNPDTNEPTGEKLSVCRYEEDRTIDLGVVALNYAPIEDLEEFVFTLEPYNQEITLKPITHAMSLRMTKSFIDRQRNIDRLNEFGDEVSVMDDRVINSYMSIMDMSIDMTIELVADSIFSVKRAKGKSIYTHDFIIEWVKRLPPEAIQFINGKINELIERIKRMSVVDYTCPECGHEQKIPLVLDADKLFLSAPGHSQG